MFDAVGGVEPLLDPQLHPHRGILKISRLSGFQVPHRQWSSHTESKQFRRIIIIILVTSALSIAYLAILT